MDQISHEGDLRDYRVLPREFYRAANFQAIRDRFMDGLLDIYEGDHTANRLILEEGRYMSYLTILSLHAAQDMSVPSTWLTLGRLQREVIELGFASRNRVEAQVSCLKKYGFLTQQTQASDRRVRLLLPTEKMLSRDMAVLGLSLAALGEFEGFAPGSRATTGLRIELHSAIRRATLANLGGIGRLMRRHSRLMAFFGHDCGYMIMLLLLQGALRDDNGRLSTCYQRLATQTGVSRTHVRRLLETARDAGLLAISGRGGHDMRVTPLMWDMADRWFAEQFALAHSLLTEARSGPARTRIAA